VQFLPLFALLLFYILFLCFAKGSEKVSKEVFKLVYYSSLGLISVLGAFIFAITSCHCGCTPFKKDELVEKVEQIDSFYAHRGFNVVVGETKTWPYKLILLIAYERPTDTYSSEIPQINTTYGVPSYPVSDSVEPVYVLSQ